MVLYHHSVPLHVGWVLLTDAERITQGQYLVSKINYTRRVVGIANLYTS
jgi:hypothetical protein